MVALLLAPAAAPAQPDPDAQAAGRVVVQQLEAFRRDDFDAAFGFASEEIHQLFDVARFEAMVRGGYPEIARSASAFIDHATRGPGGRLYLVVRVRGANGQSIEAVYEMVRENGQWRINGVVTQPDTSERAGGLAPGRAAIEGGLDDAQNKPTTLPSASMSIVSAPGVFGSPGIVRMSPA